MRTWLSLLFALLLCGLAVAQTHLRRTNIQLQHSRSLPR